VRHHIKRNHALPSSFNLFWNELNIKKIILEEQIKKERKNRSDIFKEVK
jgi:hypothetical protein